MATQKTDKDQVQQPKPRRAMTPEEAKKRGLDPAAYGKPSSKSKD
ncbi:hypothetical protein [Shimia sp. R9_2]|nr:hypothetical protein [Shimia sp. R9_2]